MSSPLPRANSTPSGPTGRLSADHDRLFVYGSLTFREVLSCLLDRVPPMEPATVRGWDVRELQGQVYPGIIPAEISCSASGFVLSGLTELDRRVLDAFESPIYELALVRPDHAPLAWTYMAPLSHVRPTAWSAERFQDQHLPAYLDRCRLWRSDFESRRASDETAYRLR